jgi:hypothetical protein
MWVRKELLGSLAKLIDLGLQGAQLMQPGHLSKHSTASSTDTNKVDDHIPNQYHWINLQTVMVPISSQPWQS